MLQRLPDCRVAILLSTFNGERFLASQLASLLDQTFEEWTLYWRDDGSTDGTLAVLEEFSRSAGQGRCVRVQLTGDRLRPTASYLALLAAVRDRLADGDMVAFADQDDVWLPEKLARGVTALRDAGNARPALYCARQMLVDEDLHPLGPSLAIRRDPGFPAALIQNVTTGCTLVLNRRAVDLVAASTPPPASVHDWWCYIVVTAAGGRLIADDQATVLYRQHAANMIGSPHSMPRRALAALRRGRAIYLTVLRQHTAALMAQPQLLDAAARAQVTAIHQALQGGPLRRLTVLPMPGLRRQTLLEMLGFWAWFLLG
jgi:glycosyltransferase involved in cell wall biosynthesis